MLLRRRKLLWSLVKMLWSSRRTQPPVDCLWSLVSSFPGLSVNSDNLPFSYVILFLLFTYVNYMHENWSWHAYRFALGFPWKKQVWQLPGSTYYSKAEYTNTQQDLPVGDNYFTNSSHERLLATGFLLMKSNKEYVLTFKILAQVLVGLNYTKFAI
jgi:hypothetical protein